MSLDKLTSMEPVKEKLRNLRVHMQDVPDIVYEFGDFLANRLNPEIFPIGFNVAAEFALNDMREGTDSFSRQPIKERGLVGDPPEVYAGLSMYIPEIAEAVCPEDFAQEVVQVYEKVKAKMRERKE